MAKDDELKITLPGIDQDGGHLSIDFLSDMKVPTSPRSPPPPIPAGMSLPLPISRKLSIAVDPFDLLPPGVSHSGPPPPVPDSAKKGAPHSPPPIPPRRQSQQPSRKASVVPTNNFSPTLLEEKIAGDNDDVPISPASVSTISPPQSRMGGPPGINLVNLAPPPPPMMGGPPGINLVNIAPPPPPMMGGPPGYRLIKIAPPPPMMSGPPPPPMIGGGPPPPPPPPMMASAASGKPKLSMQEQLALKAKARMEREENGEIVSTPVAPPPKPVDSMQDQLKARLAKRRQNEVG